MARNQGAKSKVQPNTITQQRQGRQTHRMEGQSTKNSRAFKPGTMGSKRTERGRKGESKNNKEIHRQNSKL